MSDSQIKRRRLMRRRVAASVVLCIIALGLLYFRYATNPTYEKYISDKSRESSATMDLNSAIAARDDLRAIVEENGKQLISFTEDKIKYINLASELSEKYGVYLDKLTVSDIWEEGAMSVMTTTIEVEGDLEAIQQFITSYCGSSYTNRINVVSCRPEGRYPWLKRNSDDQLVLDWFNLDLEQNIFDATKQDRVIAGELDPSVVLPSTQHPIDLKSMFADEPVKAYLVIDFLGRS